MAEEKPAEQAAPKKALPIKVIIIVVVVMALEAVAILGVAMMTRAPAAEAVHLEDPTDSADQKTIELEVLHERLPNNKQGVVYLYDTRISIQVKKKNQDLVRATLEENKARITMEIGTIWRQAEPRHFNEPHLNTLTRQVEEVLRRVVDEDEAVEESRIVGVLIPTLTGFRTDY